MATAEIMDVIIVGAGLSGLTAGYHLISAAPDLKILILEAKDRVGGRTFTTELKSAKGKDSWDLGGQWVTGTQPHITSLLEELKLECYPQYHKGTKFMQLSDGVFKTYEGSIPKLSFLSLLDLQWFLYKFERLCKDVDVYDPFNHPKGEELNSITAESYINKISFTKPVKELLNVALRATLGVDAPNMSILYILFYAKCAGGLMRLFETTHGSAQECRVKDGTQQVSHLLMRKIGDSNVKLSSPVHSIKQISDEFGNCQVEVVTEKGEKFVAKFVIVAIPTHLAVDIAFNPPLPDERRQLLTNMHVGHLTKYICTYSKAFWREKGYSGEITSTGGTKIVEGCDSGPLCIVYDATTYAGSPALVGFLGGNQGTQWTNKSYEVRKMSILSELAKCFGDEALDPLEYAEKIWTNEPYNGGCPVNVATAGIMQHMAKHLRTPLGKIHWAGTETATVWNGYLDGAVQAGRRAAKEILFNIRPNCITKSELQDTAYGVREKKQVLPKRGHKIYIMASVVFGLLIFFYTFQIAE